MECWQWGQLDLGRVMDCPWGIRWMQTFKKLPIANPKAITNPSTSMVKLYLEGPRFERVHKQIPNPKFQITNKFGLKRSVNPHSEVLNLEFVI